MARWIPNPPPKPPKPEPKKRGVKSGSGAEQRGGLTPMMTEFARLCVTGITPTDAAKQAGYADPAAEVVRLLKNPLVVKQILKTTQAHDPKWMLVGQQSLDTINKILANFLGCLKCSDCDATIHLNCNKCGDPLFSSQTVAYTANKGLDALIRVGLALHGQGGGVESTDKDELAKLYGLAHAKNQADDEPSPVIEPQEVVDSEDEIAH